MYKRIKYTAYLILVVYSLHGQYINKVHEYIPAPSQYTNAAPWGIPSSTNSLIGGINGHLSLGGFGGYIVFSFEKPVENDPDNPYGIDFTIFGNPVSGWSEPGIVSVMKDENGNGIPDDTWYELAGSDHYFSSSETNYQVTYINPGGYKSADIHWTDNYGKSGVIRANSFYTQSYYPLSDSFPDVYQSQYTLEGSMIKSTVDTLFPTAVLSRQRGFGYADNQYKGKAPYTLPDNPYTPELENSGGDAFDIGWAIDKEGNHMELDQIHFVKVHTGVMENAGWLGQISTEITGAVDVSPVESDSGLLDMIVIKDFPPVIEVIDFRIEAFVFSKGILQNNEKITWSSSLEGVTIDEMNILHLSSSGDITLTATLESNPDVSATVSTTVVIPLRQAGIKVEREFRIYPNPVSDILNIESTDLDRITLVDLKGIPIKEFDNPEGNIKIVTSNLAQGLYFLVAVGEGKIYTERIIKL